jgi:hypothetical protein
VVCVLRMRGEVGQDFDSNGLKAAIDKAKSLQPDAVVIDIDTTWRLYRGNDTTVYTDEDDSACREQRFIVAQIVREIQPFSTLDGSPAPTRIVAWVRRAVGPVAAIPLAAREIYYRGDTIHGAYSALWDVWTEEGERKHATKGRALVQGAIEAAIYRAGHSSLAEAMVQRRQPVWYTVRGGRCEINMNGAGLLLSDGVERTSTATPGIHSPSPSHSLAMTTSSCEESKACDSGLLRRV